MQFATHSDLEGKHAILSASKSHWLRYSEEKLRSIIANSMEAQKGTRLHEIAKELILMKINLVKNTKTLNLYVNDAIGFKMTPELVLYYSENCFGTADAIHFDMKKMILRIHDLKNGITPAKMEQLMVYAALFCLEYDIRPSTIQILLRIYQNDEYVEYEPTLEEIIDIMDTIVTQDRIIEQIKRETLGV
jgi:hypothetical protein